MSKRCKCCGHFFKVKHGRSKYCSMKCLRKFNRSPYVYKFGKYKKPQSKKKRRLCLGLNCEGHKYFMSDGPWNRVCFNCKGMLRDKADLDSYKFQNGRK